MGKNHRHKKQLKAEKAKTKLKGSKTKFLPKGQNITDISFKVKPIVLPDQLKPSTSSDLLTTRKLNLKEVLNRLKHHNVLIKVDNCQQLKELISSYPADMMRQNLSQILQVVCPLMLDVEGKVRNEAIKVLQCILNNVALKDIEAFFNIFSTFLRCSMTHIDSNVQEDSLLLLDILLEFVPSLVAANANQILSNFYTLMSKLNSDCKPGRTLTDNPKSKHTSVRWRVKVLHSLKGIFVAMHNYGINSTQCENSSYSTIKVNGLQYVSLCVDKYPPCSTDFFMDEITDINIDEPMVNYIRTLMPLLHETWMEVAPLNSMDLPSSGFINDTVLKEDAADTLTCVLDVLYSSWQLAEVLDMKNSNSQFKNIFMEKTTKHLINLLLKAFPYSRREIGRQKSSVESESKCIRENLLVCYIFSVVHKKLTHDAVKKMAEAVTNYINYCLSNRNYIDIKNTELFLSLLKVIYTENIHHWKKYNDIDELIQNTSRFYLHNKKIPKEKVIDVLLLLCDTVQDSEKMYEIITKLVKTLPQLILEPEVHVKTLDSLLLLVKKNVADIHKSFRQNIRAILDNLPHVVVTDSVDSYAGVVKVLSFFYYIPLSNTELNILTHFASENPNYFNFVTYIINKQ